jgi:invasion protein IalB
MDDALIQTLSNGSNAIFVVFKTPEEGIGIPVSLNGFGEGFNALP